MSSDIPTIQDETSVQKGASLPFSPFNFLLFFVLSLNILGCPSNLENSEIDVQDPWRVSESEEMSSEEVRVYYIVEKILDTRINQGDREYLILWKGFSREEATWESAKHCECPEAIAAFHRKRRAARFSESPTWKKPYPLRKKEKSSRRCMRLTRSTIVSEGYDDKFNSNKIDASTAEEKTDANLDQVQNGKKIAALLDAQRVGGELIYTVLYQGKGPRKERIDSIPSSVLRKYANENFLDCLEQYALANCENHAFV